MHKIHGNAKYNTWYISRICASTPSGLLTFAASRDVQQSFWLPKKVRSVCCSINRQDVLQKLGWSSVYPVLPIVIKHCVSNRWFQTLCILVSLIHNRWYSMAQYSLQMTLVILVILVLTKAYCTSFWTPVWQTLTNNTSSVISASWSNGAGPSQEPAISAMQDTERKMLQRFQKCPERQNMSMYVNVMCFNLFQSVSICFNLFQSVSMF